MAGEDEPQEGPWDKLRVRLISVALFLAIVMFLYRMAEDGPGFLAPLLPDADLAAMAAFLVPAAIMLGGVAVMAWSVRKVRRWPRAPGVIVSTSLAPMKNPESAGRSFRPIVRYRYTVGGVERQGRTLRHGRTEGGNEGWARQALARYPAGAPVNVLYNPLNPAESALEASLGPLGWALLVLGLLLLLGAVYAAGVI
jgi:hypothetical protein